MSLKAQKSNLYLNGGNAGGSINAKGSLDWGQSLSIKGNKGPPTRFILHIYSIRVYDFMEIRNIAMFTRAYKA